jgi:hypothetical protein
MLRLFTITRAASKIIKPLPALDLKEPTNIPGFPRNEANPLLRQPLSDLCL